MATLKDIIAAIISDIASARAEADHQSAILAEQYGKDPVLQFFPVPRVDIKDLSVELKFAVDKADIEKKSLSIVTEGKTLSQMPQQAVSVLTIDTEIKNYLWTQTDLEKEEDKKLVEV